MKFYIAVEEMRSTVIEVEAANSEEAKQKVEKAYSEDEICLTMLTTLMTVLAFTMKRININLA